MKRAYTITFTLLLLINFCGKGQTTSAISVGDKVPEVYIQKLINTEKPSAVLSDYKDQLLILDFWATTCSGCVEALPKMMALQEKFKKQVTILPVTYEKEEIVQAFLMKNHLTKGIKVASVVEDKALSALFKHQYIPHEVWIYKGKLIALTSSEYVDANNIQKILDGEVPKWPVKNDFYVHDYTKPLFLGVGGNKITNDDVMYTAISDFREGMDSKINTVYDALSNMERTYFINSTVLAIYLISWSKLIELPFLVPRPNRLILEVKDPSKYIQNTETSYRAEWDRVNRICFEMRSKGQLSVKERSERMIADMDRFLNLKGRWEKRKAKCLILYKIGEVGLQPSKSEEVIFKQDKEQLKVRKTDLRNFVYQMNNDAMNPLMFDETGYTNPVDMDLEVSSVSALKKSLSKYGLNLREEEREEYFFVLTELKK
ncbi:TlpA family protein disulfide reductase [Pedobacter caeni]|uniref:Thiol-disulfide isomerase or thioredoxin n=1 Tax=Pedobacter caeni TaxID=288992 RepID=A0A1M5JQ05_9SPHI|nr:TlpA disulfide reductase family protein [Pedobacter caeni]SHG42359.1 Thiol-disulfide isomerase or thioredoxin [Pedobacter caeni]